jgi:hypothetical protein
MNDMTNESVIAERSKYPVPVEGSLCVFAKTTKDYEGMARIFMGQAKRTPMHTEVITRMTLREAQVGKRGFFFTKTSGIVRTPQERALDKKGESLGGYINATLNSELGCTGFLFFANGKWLPVFAEELEIQITPKPDEVKALDYIRYKIGTFEQMQSAISGGIK